MNTIYWNGVYDANLEYMQNVRIRTAQFVKNNLSSHEICAAVDIGALRYHLQIPVLDLGGLTDPDFGAWYRMNQIDQYLLKNGATCLILQGASSASSNSWLEAADVLGLTNSSYKLSPVKNLGVNEDRWLQGFLPTGNYALVLTVYTLVDQ